jgi:hypothetical protein
MSDIIKVIEKLPELLSLKPASVSDISDAENQLGLRFSDEYKKYVGAFGAILADGVELTGIAKSKSRDVVSVTVQEKTLNPDVPDDLYVVENAGIDRIIIWQNETGVIFQSVSHTPPVKIAKTLADYLINTQG